MAILTDLTIKTRGSQALPAASAADLVRLGEVLEMLSGVAAGSHTHLLADIADLAAQLPARLRAILADTAGFRFGYAGGILSGVLVTAPNSGLLLTGDGWKVDFGPGTYQVAAGDHGHADLHPAWTLQASETIEGTVSLQAATLQVRLQSNGGVLAGPSGVRCDFGTANHQVARGDHGHAGLHNPVTVQGSQSLSLSVDGNQLINGTVELASSPPFGYGRIVSGAGGLMVELGSGVDQAAAGYHPHPIATRLVDGFMSTAQVTVLETFASGVQAAAFPDQVAHFYRESNLTVGTYVGGRVRFLQAMEIRAANVVALAPVLAQRVALEIGGVEQAHSLWIPAGTAGTEVMAESDFGVVTVAVSGTWTPWLRWKCVEGTQPEANGAGRVSLNVNLRKI